MAAAVGLDKFSQLEDKIHRTIELCKTLRQEKERLESELAAKQDEIDRERERRRAELEAKQQEITSFMAEKNRLEAQIIVLRKDREAMKLKVEAMLDAVTMLELEAESLKALKS